MRIGIAAATCLVLVVSCGSNTPGTVEAQQRDVNPTTTTATEFASTTVATTTTTPPPTTTCRGSQWTMSVSSGWFANVQPAGSKFLSCWLVAPATVAQRFGIVDGVMSIPESADARTEWLGPWIGVSLTQLSVQELLAEFVRNSGSDATVEIADSDIRIIGVAPAFSLRPVVVDSNDRNVRVRARYTIAESIGYLEKGSVSEVLLVATPNGGTVMASINSGYLPATPAPGISIDDAAAALDAIAKSLRLT